MDNLTRPSFVPVQGKEVDLLLTTPAPGCIYFATDTGKMFMDVMDEVSGEYVHNPIGGAGAALLYANSSSPTEQPDGSFLLSLSELEDPNAKPNVDDLIINVDGKFLRVTSINFDGSFVCALIAVSGSGGGSGGGGGEGGGGVAVGTANFSFITPATYNCRYGDAIKIKFNFTSSYADGTSSGVSSATLHINNGLAVKTVQVVQGDNEIDITDIIAAGTQKLTIAISADIGNTSPTIIRRTWTIIATALRFSWEHEVNNLYNSDGTFTLFWRVEGDGVEKVTHIIVDGNEATETQVVTTVNSKNEEYSMDGLPHGTHTIEMYMSAKVGNQELSTERISHQLMFVAAGNTMPVVAFATDAAQMQQYDTAFFKIVVHDPEAVANQTTLTIRENDVDLQTYPVTNDSIFEWTYTPTTPGEKKITFVCKGSDNNHCIIDVAEVNLGDVVETSGYAFKLQANQLSGNLALQAWKAQLTDSIYSSWAEDEKTVDITFSDNFDWVNGGVTYETLPDGTTRPYICVRAGTTMTINYDLFRVANSSVRERGKAFKFIFKATNCKKYDGQVLTCYNQGLGLRMDAQKAVLTTGEATLETQYCEDKYIEFEFDVWPVKSNRLGVALNYLMFWIDGVPTNIAVYASAGQHTQPAGYTVPITIGSDDCDVQVYLVKAYEKHLDDEEHLNNFIMDSYNATAMMDRFLRNDIVANGEINYTKLVERNPNCPVFLYDIPRMTKNKKDKVGDGEEGADDYITFQMYKNGDSSKPYVMAENVRMKVQGTSSARYGVAAFNFDTDFKDGFVDSEGNASDGFAIKENSIPVDYFCTKVNVASCENANNALNQEWYNTYQPWKNRLRRKNPNARDCMEFIPGVVFFRDRNKTTEVNADGTATSYDARNVFCDTDGYIDAPFYKQYSIGNMGNSKDNLEVLHDLTNPYEVCVENADNQEVGQWMTELQGVYITVDADGKDVVNYQVISPIPDVDDLETTMIECRDGNTRSARDLWEKAFTDLYEFRYPDGIDELKDTFKTWTDEDKAKWPELANLVSEGILTEDRLAINPAESAIRGWYRFVTWMIQNDVCPQDPVDHPHGYTGELLPAPETYTEEDLTLEDSYYSGSLKGQKLTAYVGTYTHDTRERRMAKMIKECEDYLAMESVVFHYLFIERHTMVDNVAKNTFWSTEDGIHWNLTKDYDNDTADGNDNQGRLSLTYGIECLDKKADNKNYFNASQSTWFNFINGLYTLRKALYVTCAGRNAWKATPYLNAFEEWQKDIPERCWIEDYYRKYRRPRELKEDEEGFYIGMLEGGQKRHQRAQYETYQESYIDSLYNVDNYESTKVITIRSDGVLPMEPDQEAYPGLTIGPRVKLYADGYVRAKVGSQEAIAVRGKRGQTYTIRLQATEGANLNNATFYIAQPSNIAALTGVGLTSPTQISFSSAKKLSEIDINNLTDKPNLKLENLTFGDSLPLLEKITAQKCPNTKVPLEMNKLNNLREINIQGSGFTSVSFAPGGLLETAHLNSATQITASKMNRINEFTLTGHSITTTTEENGDITTTVTLSEDPVDGCLLLRNLSIIDCPNIDTYSLVKNIKAGLGREGASETEILTYRLNGVNWNINEAEGNIDFENTSIPVLDFLLSPSAAPEENLTTALSLSDSMTFGENVTFPEDDEVGAFGFYDKYITPDKFGNFDIIFENEALPLVTIYDIAGNIQWERRSRPGATIDENFLGADNKAPDGVFVPPTSYATAMDVYTFLESWDAITEDGTTIVEGIKPLDYVVTKNVVFKPRVEKTIKHFTVTFYHADGVNIYYQTQVPYNGLVGSVAPMVGPGWIGAAHPNLYHTYSFKGYAVNNGKNKVIDLSQVAVTSDMEFIACYEPKHVFKNPLTEEYLTITRDGSINSEHGCLIGLAKGANVAGKLTIPYKIKTRQITGVEEEFVVEGIVSSGFQNSSSDHKTEDVTHIFFEPKEVVYDADENVVSMTPNTEFVALGHMAFNWCGAKYIELPPNIHIMRGGAISTHVAPFTNSKVKEILLHPDMTVIPDGIFDNANNLETINLSDLVGLTRIGKYAFQSCNVLGITLALSDFTALTEIGDYAFNSCGSLKLPAGDEMALPASVERIGRFAFKDAFNSQFTIKLSSPKLSYGLAPFFACSRNNQNLGYTAINYDLPAESFEYTIEPVAPEDIAELPKEAEGLYGLDGTSIVPMFAINIYNKTAERNIQRMEVTCAEGSRQNFINMFKNSVYPIMDTMAMKDEAVITPSLIINNVEITELT